MYVLFSIRPLTTNVARAILKRPKIYFYDNADAIGDEEVRLENLVATHLLKRLHFLEDYTGDSHELCYLRDKEKREVDFAIIKNKKLMALIEVKLSDEKISKNLLYFANQLKPQECVQIVLNLKRPFHSGNVLVTDPIHYFHSFIPWN